jgi:hypothetical protein
VDPGAAEGRPVLSLSKGRDDGSVRWDDGSVRRSDGGIRPDEAVRGTSRCACGGGCPRCGGGQALAAPLRASMESRLGTSFADVRIHADTDAARASARTNAHAFTMGNDVFFATGKFAPETREGATRLAHELVHVQQQRAGRRGAAHADTRSTEREARQLGAEVASGAHARVRLAARAAVQRDGPDAEGSGSPTTVPPSGPADLLLRHFIRWWLGTTLVDGQAPASPPPSPDADDYSEPEAPAAAPVDLSLPPTFVLRFPLASPFFTPLPADPLFIEPDVGALYSSFGTRGAPAGEGDEQVVLQMYRRNEAIVRALPDLRAAAPGFLKPLIPPTWRRDIAGALVGAETGASLNRDFMTPIEVSDRAWQGMTGASTTVIPFPSLSF